MLPFLKPKSVSGLIVQKRKSDGSQEMPQDPQEQDSSGLEACAEDMIRAFHTKDAKALASAFQSAFEICDSQPHEEGPHIESE